MEASLQLERDLGNIRALQELTFYDSTNTALKEIVFTRTWVPDLQSWLKGMVQHALEGEVNRLPLFYIRKTLPSW